MRPMSRARRGGAAAKTDNEKYVRRGADLVIEYNPGWEGDVRRANEGKVGAPYQYADALVMMAAALRSALGVKYRQLEGMVGRMAGRSNTPAYSQLYKRITKLDADISRGSGGVVTVSDRKSRRILALDASGLKQHNRGEWMRAKWKKRRGFVKMHILVDTETMKILALEVTDDSVGDSAMFGELLGQVAGAGYGAGRSLEPPAAPPPGAAGSGSNSSSVTGYENLLASGVLPLASLRAGGGAPRGAHDAPDVVLGDAAYGSRENAAACARAQMVPGILHKINVTARGKGSGDAWGESVRDQLGGNPDATRLDLMSREEKRENQTYWKTRIGYGQRWLAESVFSAFKRLFGEHLMALKWENIVQEVRLKVSLYNRWRDESIAREAGGGTA